MVALAGCATSIAGSPAITSGGPVTAPAITSASAGGQPSATVPATTALTLPSGGLNELPLPSAPAESVGPGPSRGAPSVPSSVVVPNTAQPEDDSPAAAEPGDCIDFDDTGQTAHLVSCTTGEYVVVQRVASSNESDCDGSEDDFLYSARGDFGLCVDLNAKVGDCYDDNDNLVSCSSSQATEKVLAVLTDTQDDAGCPSTSDESDPQADLNRVVCFGDPTGVAAPTA